MFDTNELEEIRHALYRHKERLEENMQTSLTIKAQLEVGQLVPMFAPGDAGIRAAAGMVESYEHRITMTDKLIDRLNDKLYGTGEDDE